MSGLRSAVGEVVLEDHLQQIARAVRLGLLRIGGRRHAARQQHQRLHPLGVFQREEQRRRPALRQRDHRRLPDAKVVQQAGIGIGLRFEGRARGQRRAQVAVSRRRDPAKTIANHGAGDQRTLIETAATAMHHEHRRAGTTLHVFDALVAHVNELALPRDAVVRAAHLPQVHAWVGTRTVCGCGFAA